MRSWKPVSLSLFSDFGDCLLFFVTHRNSSFTNRRRIKKSAPEVSKGRLKRFYFSKSSASFRFESAVSVKRIHLADGRLNVTWNGPCFVHSLQYTVCESSAPLREAKLLITSNWAYWETQFQYTCLIHFAVAHFWFPHASFSFLCQQMDSVLLIRRKYRNLGTI